jgi:hypothetical protein
MTLLRLFPPMRRHFSCDGSLHMQNAVSLVETAVVRHAQYENFIKVAELYFTYNLNQCYHKQV